MSRDKKSAHIPYNIASLIRGLYGRVAKQLDVDPSYVSRVARGERRSDDIEAALERELKRVAAMMEKSRNGSVRHGHKNRAKTKTKSTQAK